MLSRPRTICLHLAVLAAALYRAPLLFSQTSTDAAAFGKTIRSIEYASDRPVMDRAYLDSVVGLRPGQSLTSRGVRDSLQALYDTGRFSNISVDAWLDGEQARLLFHLRWSYYFNRFTVRRRLMLGGRSLLEAIPLPVGEKYTQERLEGARQAVLGFLKGQGFYDAKVRTETGLDEKLRQVDVVFLVDPGELATIRSIPVAGVPAPEEENIRQRFGFRIGQRFDRRRLERRLERLRRYLIQRGFLAAVPELTEEVSPDARQVDLKLHVSDFGRVRVSVEGYNVERQRLRRLLPVLSGEGVQPELVEEGSRNLKEYLEEQGYPEAFVEIVQETDKSGIRVLKYRVDAGRKVTVAYVRFRGNKAADSETLLAAIQIQPARFLQKSFYSVTRLDDDVESLLALYRARGYLKASVIPVVELAGAPDRLGITFECEEGPLARTASISITGGDALPGEGLKSRLALREGGTFSYAFAERDRQTILASYNDIGHLQARVTYSATASDKPETYDVRFEIEGGRQSLVSEILILGNERTRESVIRRRITLEEGEPLSLGRMLATQQALYALGAFDRVRLGPQNPDSQAARQTLVVRVQESKSLTLRYGLGYQERERVRGTVEISHLNLLGLGRRVDLRLRGSRIEQQGILSFQQPRFFFLPVDSYLILSAQKKREVSFDVRRFNASYQYSRPVSSHAWTVFRYNFRNVHVSDVKDVERGRDDTPRNLSTFSAIYINDTRDNYLDPEKGFFTSTDLSVTTKLLGSNNFVSLYTQSSYFRPLPGPVRLAASLRFGTAHPYGGDSSLPISERYFAGGASSLRGFDTDRAGPLNDITNAPKGGNAVFITNFEGRARLFRAIDLAVFLDSGNVFSTLGDMTLAGFSHTAGVGLRIRTPFGPLRADYGFNLNLPGELRERGFSSRRFFVTIGPPF